MIIENSPISNRFISIPKEYDALNCAAFFAGMIHGMLESADFVSASQLRNDTVTAVADFRSHASGSREGDSAFSYR